MNRQEQLDFLGSIGKVIGVDGSMDGNEAIEVLKNVREAIINNDLIFRTEEEGDNEGFFDVVRIHRDDIESAGYDSSNVDDSTMERLASKMGDIMVEYYFWDMLPDLCELFEIPQKEESEDEDEE